MKQAMIMLGALAVLSGCTVERVGPPGSITQAVRVKARDVAVYDSPSAVPGRFGVVEEIWVKDTEADSVETMTSELRQKAGAIGANAIVLHPLNRKPNGTRVTLGVQLDNPFDYFRATAIWIGEGERPVRYLGPLGQGGRP